MRQITATRNEAVHNAMDSEATRKSGFVALFESMNRLTGKHYDRLYKESQKAFDVPNKVPAGSGQQGLVAVMASKLNPWAFGVFLEEYGLAKDGKYALAPVQLAGLDTNIRLHTGVCLARFNKLHQRNEPQSSVSVYSCKNTCGLDDAEPFNMLSTRDVTGGGGESSIELAYHLPRVPGSTSADTNQYYCCSQDRWHCECGRS